MEDWEREEQERDEELSRLALLHDEVSKKGPWKIEPHDGINKRFGLTNSDTGLQLYVDYDDVNHVEVDLEVAELVEMLNIEAHLGTYRA